MEMRKNRRYSLEARRTLFLSIGLCASLALVSMAFEYKTIERPIVVGPPDIDPFVDAVIEIKATSFPKPKPKKQKAIVIQPKITASTVATATEAVKAIFDEPETAPQPFIDGHEDGEGLPPEKIEEPPLNWAEKMPAPVGGMEAFVKYLQKNLKYPSQARRIGIEGRVFVQFVVDKEGQISNIKTIKGVSEALDEEAMRAIRAYKAGWEPGQQGTEKVTVRMIMPIYFKLN